MSFTIVTININGICAVVKERSETNLGLLEWLKHTGSDVTLLQEVHTTDDQVYKTPASAFDARWHWVGAENPGTKRRAGMDTLPRFPLSDVQVDIGSEESEESGRFTSGVTPAADTGLDTGVQIASPYLLSGAALSEKQDEKYRFLDVFSDHLADLGAKGRDGHHAVIGDDWNICHRKQDLRNWKTDCRKSGFLPQGRAWMDSVFGCWPDKVLQDPQVQTSDKELESGTLSDGFVREAPVFNADPVWFDVTCCLHPETDGPWSWWTYRGKAFDIDAGRRINYQAVTEPMLKRAVSAVVDKPTTYDPRWTDCAPVIVEYA